MNDSQDKPTALQKMCYYLTSYICEKDEASMVEEAD